MADYAFIALVGKQAIKGHTFTAVGDALQDRGYDMSRISQIGDREYEIPHTNPKKGYAKLHRNGVELEEEVVEAPSVQIASLEITAVAIMSGASEPVGLQTRDCGAVHPDGVACFIGVLFEARPCGCGDYIYEHDGPHEAVDDSGVRYRWEEVMTIEDLPFNAYGPMEDANG